MKYWSLYLRLQELKAELNESRQSRTQLETVTFTLTEELRSLRGRIETQQAEFGTALSDVRNRARKLEEENRIHVCNCCTPIQTILTSTSTRIKYNCRMNQGF